MGTSQHSQFGGAFIQKPLVFKARAKAQTLLCRENNADSWGRKNKKTEQNDLINHPLLFCFNTWVLVSKFKDSVRLQSLLNIILLETWWLLAKLSKLCFFYFFFRKAANHSLSPVRECLSSLCCTPNSPSKSYYSSGVQKGELLNNNNREIMEINSHKPGGIMKARNAYWDSCAGEAKGRNSPTFFLLRSVLDTLTLAAQWAGGKQSPGTWRAGKLHCGPPDSAKPAAWWNGDATELWRPFRYFRWWPALPVPPWCRAFLHHCGDQAEDMNAIRRRRQRGGRTQADKRMFLFISHGRLKWAAEEN